MKKKRMLAILLALTTMLIATAAMTVAYAEPSQIGNGWPEAVVTPINEQHGPVDVNSLNNLWGENPYGKVTPSVVYNFAISEYHDKNRIEDYYNWNCDYVVSITDGVDANSFGLFGNYGSYGDIAFFAPKNIPGNYDVPLLGSVAKIPWTYKGIYDLVQSFTCGAFNTAEENLGKTFTVKLVIWDPEYDNYYDAKENDKVHVVESIDYVINTVSPIYNNDTGYVYKSKGTNAAGFTLNEQGEVVSCASIENFTGPHYEPVVARIGNHYYSDLEAAMAAVDDNETVTLLADVTLSKKLIINKGKTFTFDLGGNTLTGRINMYNTNVTITNGTVDAGTMSQALNVYGTDDPSFAGKEYTVVNIESDVTVTGAYGICFMSNVQNTYYPLCYGVTVNMKGTTNAGSPMYVSGNIGFDNFVANLGNAYNVNSKLPADCKSPSAAMVKYGPVFNVLDGAKLIADGNLSNENSQGISLSGMVTVNVYDGATISGGEGIGMKSGVLNVYGGSIIGSGSLKDPIQAVNSGTEASGGAISLSSYYQSDIYGEDAGEMQVNVYGGTIQGINNSAIRIGHSYNKNKKQEPFEQGVRVNVTGGTFNSGYEKSVYMEDAIDGDDTYIFSITGGIFTSDPSTYVADGYAAVPIAEDPGKYIVGEVITKDLQAEDKEITPDTNEVKYTASIKVEDKNGTELYNASTVQIAVSVDKTNDNAETDLTKFDLDEVVEKSINGSGSVDIDSAKIYVDVDNVNTDTQNKVITFSATPFVAAYKNNQPVGNPVELDNSSVKGTFTLKFDVTALGVKEGDTVKVTHISSDEKIPSETFAATVKKDSNFLSADVYYIETEISHFSQFTIEQITPVAGNVAVNLDTGNQYDTLQVAIDDASSGNTIVLLDNIALTATQNITKNLTIDLNGHNITATDARALWIKNGVVTITGGGTISANGESLNASSSVIRVGDSDANNAAAKLTVGEDVTVSSGKCYGITVFGNNDTDNDKETSDIELVLNGKVNVTGTASAVSGNGTSTLSATTMTIGSTAEVTATQDYAIYHPGRGTLTVNGKVEGLGGIEVKGGSVKINAGATVKATATEQTHSAYNNGASTSGYAIAAVNNPGYAGDPKVEIAGGTITGKTIMLADFNAENNGVVTATSNEIAVPEGYKWVETETAGTYKLVEIEYAAQIVRGGYYETVQAAIDAVGVGQTATIISLTNTVGAVTLNANKTITLDLNCDETTWYKKGYVVLKQGNLTLTNGRLAGYGYSVQVSGSADSTVNAGDYNSLTIDSTAIVGNGGGYYGIILWPADGTNNAYGSRITVNGKVLDNIFVSGNILSGNSEINISGENALVKGNDIGIALNGSANLNVSGGTIIGGTDTESGTGIEVRSGNLNVTGGTIEGKGEYSFTPNGNGTSSTGCGIAVAQHTTENNINVSISDDAIVKGTVALALANPQKNDDGSISVSVSGGKFTSTATGSNAVAVYQEDDETRVNGFISGGSFSSVVDEDYCSPGYMPVKEQDAQGMYTVTDNVILWTSSDESTTLPFDNLADGIVHANTNGGTVTLLADVEISEGVDVSGTVTLDLNGKTVANTSNITTDYLIAVLHGGTLNVEDSVGGGKISMDKHYCAIKMTKANDGDATKNATLVVNSGTIEGYDFAISGNGNDGRGNSVITINGGVIRNTKTAGTGDDAAIYQPNTGTVTLNGGTITGLTGVEVRAGNLVIPADSTVVITGTGNPAEYNGNANGTTTFGAGIAIAQHTTDHAINATIAGGNVSGAYALAFVNPNNRTAENVSVAVSGGTFIGTGNNKESLKVTDARVTKFVSGGSFSNVLTNNYCAALYTPVTTADENGLYTVKKEAAPMTLAASLTLNDNINLNVIFSNLTKNVNAYSVKSVFNGTEQVYPLSDAIKYQDQGVTKYKLSVAEVYSYQMGLPATITVIVDGAEYITFNYSVQQYFLSMYNNPSTPAGMKDICKAGLDYGASAQLYFDGRSYEGGVYDTDSKNLINESTNPYNTINATKPTGYAASASKDLNFTGLSNLSSALVLGSEVSIKVYFKYSGDIHNLKFSAVRTDKQGEARTVTDPVLGSDGRYFVKISGIKSYELYRDYTLTMEDSSNNTFKLTYSPYCYAQQNWESDDSELAVLLQSLVAYGDYAKAYWPNA